MAKPELIDRTALVTELEGLKAILGDVFLGMVMERAIERVKAQPVVEAAPKDCRTCKYACLTTMCEPCRDCWPHKDFRDWEYAEG